MCIFFQIDSNKCKVFIQIDSNKCKVILRYTNVKNPTDILIKRNDTPTNFDVFQMIRIRPAIIRTIKFLKWEPICNINDS